MKAVITIPIISIILILTLTYLEFFNTNKIKNGTCLLDVNPRNRYEGFIEIIDVKDKDSLVTIYDEEYVRMERKNYILKSKDYYKIVDDRICKELSKKDKITHF